MEAKKKLKYQLFVAGASTLGAAMPVLAAPPELQNGASTAAQDTGLPDNLQAEIKNITNTMLLVIGIAAVIMLIVGGFRYIFSAGDQNAVTGAKNTILYAVIGIVVAILAFAIVNFVISRF